VYWIPLAGLRDPDLVVPSVAQVLGVRDDLARHLAERKALLLFDNFEHLLDAAAPVAELLTAAPEMRALVTSRAALRIAGEVEVPLEPLGEEDAMTLFLERARAVGRKLERDPTVREICRRLDRLPLALELAAARARLLDGEALLARLDKRLPLLVGGRRDAPTRQRTLRATIEWSHELLEPNAQSLFARLAVFAGSFSLGTAEAVCDAELDIVAALVDESLLKSSVGDRFLMLETIREYAVEQLEELGNADDLRRLHALHFLELAEAATPHLRGPDLGPWLDQLAEDHDNFRGALDFFERSGDADAALRMAVALFRFWFIRGYSGEARKRLEYALTASDRRTPTRAKALDSAATLALDEADPVTARRYAGQSLALHRELGDTSGIARSLIRLAQAAADGGDLAEGRSLADESARLFREIGDVDSLRSATHELGWMTFAGGDVEQAREIHEQNLLRARAAGDQSIEAASLELLSLIAVAEGRADDARTMLAQSYRINRDLGYPFGIAFDLDYLAAAASESRPLLAVRLLSRADALRTEIGIRVRGLDATINERTLRTLRAELDEESFDAAWAEGRELDVDEAVRLSIRGPERD
jgi:predicted ATPase